MINQLNVLLSIIQLRRNAQIYLSVINYLESKSSSVTDEYSSKIVKHSAKELTPPLVSIINKSFTCGELQTSLKLSKVFQKHKKGSTIDIKNYHPIYLISTFSKIVERFALNRPY